jgi:ATP-dependent DNA ligase
VNLPLSPPLAPMEAQIAARLPEGDQWQYEPKWDGFRCLVFRDQEKIEIQSKAGKPLRRYFPEVIERLLAIEAPRFVLDGEIVVPVKGIFSFDDLLQRIHPAESRINRLARERPAEVIVFDLLVEPGGKPLLDQALERRRDLLERFAEHYLRGRKGVALSPATRSMEMARAWLDSEDINLDGVVAKRLDEAYLSGERRGMLKVKRKRTADCVVGGFRYGAGATVKRQAGREIGSLLLGLHDADGLLHHVGFCSGLSKSERQSLVHRLEPLIQPPGFNGRAPGGPSRWRTAETPWQPLTPQLVVEVEWDHFTGGRFRHGTRLLRWRPDKPPAQCTFEQVTFNP